MGGGGGEKRRKQKTRLLVKPFLDDHTFSELTHAAECVTTLFPLINFYTPYNFDFLSCYVIELWRNWQIYCSAENGEYLSLPYL